MNAVFGAFGIIGVLVGIGLMILGLVKKRKYRGWLVTLISFIIFIAAVFTSQSDNNPTSSKALNPTSQTKIKNWKDKIKVVAASNGTKTEKFDQISIYAKKYKPSKEEAIDFANFIIKQYKDKKYIIDISNDEHMLENIFKSQVVNQYYGDNKPLGDFAFDFWQNSKYNYRGVETPNSEFTMENERQMDKSLTKIK